MLIHKIYSIFMNYFRSRRLKQLKQLIPAINTPIRILDVGGDISYPWEALNTPAQVTILNISLPEASKRDQRYDYVQGDGCSLPYDDKSFDLIFSNSVIEHVGGWDRQIKFSREIMRVGKAFYIQTPNRKFFIEPHLIAPFIHWLPYKIERLLVRWLSIWGWVARPTQQYIDEFLLGTFLLDFKQIQNLFVNSEIYKEKFWGMAKSFIVVHSDGS